MYQYDYDELYRLNRATFCTYAGSTSTMTVTALSDYRVDNLTYDRNGNIQSLRRRMQNTNYPFTAPTMDDLTYSYDGTKTNRLKQVSDASTTTALAADIDLPDQSNSSNYTYNAIGQAITNVQEGTTMEYDVYGQVTRVYKTSTGYNVATYIYNDKGQRAAKTIYDGSGEPLTQTNYMYDGAGNLACTYETSWATGSAVTTIKDYPIYGASRIGIYDGTSPRNSSAVYYYEMSDHLGNVRAVYKNNGSGAEIVSFTDYYPHGGAMPARNYTATNYRYGYQGQEKDPETNQTSFELRQFDPRIGRWIAPDPMGQYHSPYMAMGNNPILMVDPSGGMDYSWMADMMEYHNQNPEGLQNWNPNWSKSQFNGTGDNFFATDAHFQAVNWSDPGAISAAFSASVEQRALDMQSMLSKGSWQMKTFTIWNPPAYVSKTVPYWKPLGYTYSPDKSNYTFLNSGGITGSSTKAFFEESMKKPDDFFVPRNKSYKIEKLFYGKDYKVDREAYSGFWGKLEFYRTGGVQNGQVYDINGKWQSVAPKLMTGTAPLPGGLGKSVSIIRSLGAASRVEMLAAKLKLNINSPVAKQVLNSLDETVESFIAGNRKASIRSVFPEEFLNLTVEQALRSGNSTVRKLLIDSRFIK